MTASAVWSSLHLIAAGTWDGIMTPLLRLGQPRPQLVALLRRGSWGGTSILVC